MGRGRSKKDLCRKVSIFDRNRVEAVSILDASPAGERYNDVVKGLVPEAFYFIVDSV